MLKYNDDMPYNTQYTTHVTRTEQGHAKVGSTPLYFSSLLSPHLITGVHLIELVDAANTIIREQQCPGLDAELERGCHEVV